MVKRKGAFYITMETRKQWGTENLSCLSVAEVRTQQIITPASTCVCDFPPRSSTLPLCLIMMFLPHFPASPPTQRKGNHICTIQYYLIPRPLATQVKLFACPANPCVTSGKRGWYATLFCPRVERGYNERVHTGEYCLCNHELSLAQCRSSANGSLGTRLNITM
jgi:hypothetical protein